MIPCQAACPVQTDAGKYVQLIAEGRDQEAYLVARSPNPFASVCGRICAAPCEDQCRRGKIDAPISIRALKRFVCERHGVESMDPDTQEKLLRGTPELGNKQRWHLPVMQASRKNVARGQKVAVIGAGPAGLACAHDLAIMGYRVTIFEATGQPGGMMFHGIPEFRLSRAVIEKEVDRVIQLGAEIKLGQPLTAEFGIKELRTQGYEAIFLSVGVQKGRDLNIEGSHLDGVIKAVDYLININNGYRVKLGQKVVVIGGGFVAFDAARLALRAGIEELTEPSRSGEMKTALDAARAALRAGAVEVYMASLESFEEMPVMRTTQGKEEFEEESGTGPG
jgi:NADPH-dependent glutamate synthase beta subunit-like oxidoreductase